MFIDIGNGWHLNLHHVARVHVMDHGGSGASIRFYAANGETMGEINAATPQELTQLIRAIQAYGGVAGAGEDSEPDA